MAIVYSSLFHGPALIDRAQTHIMRYNVDVGGENTDSAGYHHSLTVFWLWVATEFLKTHTYASLAEACNAFISSPYSDRTYPLNYFSKTRLFSVEARRGWVEPDLREMGKLVGGDFYQ